MQFRRLSLPRSAHETRFRRVAAHPSGKSQARDDNGESKQFRGKSVRMEVIPFGGGEEVVEAVDVILREW